MPKPKTIKIDCSKQMNKDIKYDKTSFVPDMEPFIEDYKRHRDTIKYLKSQLKQQEEKRLKSFLKHTKQALKYVRKSREEFEKAEEFK